MGKRDQPGDKGNEEDIASDRPRDEGDGFFMRRIRGEYETYREGK